MRTRRRRSRGFTLIELLVVVSIIGVLAAIAIPSFMGRQGKAYDARVMLDARSAATAQEAYFGDIGSYFTGACTGLPGVNPSPGVVCNATGGPNTFSITTSHPMASKACTWSNLGVPNLNCS
jgi:type IV pilus assembly protein PilA